MSDNIKHAPPEFDAFPDDLADDLRQQLELAEAWAMDQFTQGKRVHGWTPAFEWVSTFFRSYFLQGGVLLGTRGFVTSSRAAQHASNRAAMLYCMAIEEE